MWTSLSKKIYLFLGILFTIGLILGIIFLVYLDESSKEIILLNINEWLQGLENTHLNNILPHIIILSSLFILSLFLVGLPLILFFVFYNGFSIGFMLMALVDIFGIKGILYGIIYTLISKGIYLFLLFIFIITMIKIVVILFKNYFKKEKMSKDGLNLLFKRTLICIAGILISDIILYFWGSKIIMLFNFLLN